ncbi:DUF4241 domain-containing protein [Methylobacterium sp. AMS5]|uniref:DUF4241 domain-containing protein n=1 Tax=Methylobacterium sp. AMS5 TaxID=925818 RepID=UPI000A85C76D|nr:DUF4241 domain-containing protein [Methylobacterium sp. AMS5]
MPRLSDPSRRTVLGLAAAAVGVGLAASLARLFPWQQAGRDGDQPVADKPYDPRENEPNLSVTGLMESELQARGITRMALGLLPLPGGAVIATDPLVQPERQPFTRKVAPGDYPVTLYHAQHRVALAELRFADGTPDRWELALLPGQDVATLKAGEIFGYPVDAGLGCFMDPAARAAMARRDAREQERPRYSNYFDDVLADELKDENLHCVMHRPLPDDPARIAVFSSGWGDGVYASYWALDAAGQPLRLVTDFGVIENGEGRDPRKVAVAAALAALTPEQRRDSERGYEALKADDLATFSALLDAGRIAPETPIEAVEGTFTFEAIRLNKPEALERLVRHGATLLMPPYLQIGDERKTYPAYARDLNAPRSPQLLAVIAAWERTGSTDTPSRGQTQP